MKVTAKWIVGLPLKFLNRNDFKKTKLNTYSFSIDNVDIEFILTVETGIIEKVKIELRDDYEDSYLPSCENINYLSEFLNLITYRAGSAIQGFLDGFSRNTNDEYYQIFDGEDFLTPYDFTVVPNITSGSGNQSEGHCYLDDELLTKSLEFASKRKDLFDTAWYLLREAEYSMEQGKYEISILNMAIMIEMFVITVLSDKLDDNGYFIKDHADVIKDLYGGKASFTEKYFKYGLSLLTEHAIPQQLLDSIDFIYKVRNKLAHGKQLMSIEILIERGIDRYNIRNFWFDLNNDTTEVYNYFYDLNKELRFI